MGDNDPNAHIAELRETVQEHGTRLALAEHRIDGHDDLLGEMKDTIESMGEFIAKTATKDDVNEIHAHVDSSINGILRDAIGAMPQYAAVHETRRGNRWLEWSAMAAALSFVVLVVTWIVEHVRYIH